MDECPKWEYRVQTFGGVLRDVKDQKLQDMLNEWGVEGWEVISAIAPDNSSAVRVIARRVLTSRALRERSRPI